MDGFDLTIVILNMVGAIAALVCNLYAAISGPIRLRPIRIGITFYAGIFALAYAWLAVFEDVTAWSRVMRGVALGTWPMVWCGPAIAGQIAHRHIVHDIEKLGE